MKKLFRFILKTILWFVLLSVVWVFVHKYIPVYYTPLMAIQNFKGNENFDLKHEWKSIDEISSGIQLAVICSEDQNFIKHNGFDVTAIKKAYKENLEGKKLKGASTISQQTAKNVFLWPQRSWLRKGFESWFTLLIETIWSKERILEVYLNSIEMGEGVFGVEAASKHWFNVSAKNLSRNQSAAIAAILPNPTQFKASPASNYISKRKRWILLQMKNYGVFTLKENDESKSD
ncbi:MAG: monofunctional biosynthetic peptidoglycan transglycosylase [Flavobacteriaceae bacterium]|nr:monofunctional biosynthetic peptidoglycan transglycosylase [Flavobacteriaceae bacterium]